MPRTPAKVSQADIARVLRAVAASGMKMRVEIEGGKIVLEPVAVAADPQVRYTGQIKL